MIECNHEYGVVEDTMDIVKIAHKGKTLDALERFFIFQTKSKPMMNEQFTADSIVLFDLIVERDRQNENE
jgi:hypothetical protein